MQENRQFQALTKHSKGSWKARNNWIPCKANGKEAGRIPYPADGVVISNAADGGGHETPGREALYSPLTGWRGQWERVSGTGVVANDQGADSRWLVRGRASWRWALVARDCVEREVPEDRQAF